MGGRWRVERGAGGRRLGDDSASDMAGNMILFHLTFAHLSPATSSLSSTHLPLSTNVHIVKTVFLHFRGTTV